MRWENQRKINDKVLYRLLVEEGRSQQEAAAHFGVSEAAVSKRVKALNLHLNRHVGLERAKDVADYGLDVVRQLQGINDVIQNELSWAVEEAAKPGADRKGLEQVIIDLTGEVRKQLRFQLEILCSLYDMRGVAEFQREVLDAIGEVSPETRQAIIRRLVERRSLRSAIAIPGAGW
jgi:DNA-directed RNA polymerase specialized sigma24 family protein